MDFGFTFFATPIIHEEARRAERLGFTHAWLYASQMLASEVYASLALCAASTKTIKLGPGVTNPKSRIAPLTACGIGTIAAIAPGRVILGIGTGNTARRTLGMPAARVDELRQHIETVRGLLEGRTVPYEEDGRRRMIRFLNPKTGWVNLKKRIPIYVAASGPKSLELAGELADGVILFGTVGPSLIEFALRHVRAGAERARRDPKKIYVLCMTAFHLTKPREKLESPAVRRAVGPFVTSSSNIFALASDAADLPADLRDGLVAFRSAYRVPDESPETRHLTLYSEYLRGFKKEHEPLVTEQMIRATTLTGTRDEVLAAVRAMGKAGVDQVVIQPVTDVRKTLETFSREIIRNFRR